MDKFHSKISITSEEETKLGTPEDLHGRYSIAVASTACDVRRMGDLATIINCHGDSPRRARHNCQVPIHSYSLPVPFNLAPTPSSLRRRSIDSADISEGASVG